MFWQKKPPRARQLSTYILRSLKTASAQKYRAVCDMPNSAIGLLIDIKSKSTQLHELAQDETNYRAIMTGLATGINAIKKLIRSRWRQGQLEEALNSARRRMPETSAELSSEINRLDQELTFEKNLGQAHFEDYKKVITETLQIAQQFTQAHEAQMGGRDNF